ncbi:MAG: poly-gamma-glutamate synthase PgsB [bacterium]
MLVLILLLVLMLLYGVVEFRQHQRRVRSIPIRIHVNGTRGKSSVTRLIAAGLRAGGVKTVAKTTGTLPRIIDEKALEVEIIRHDRANIIEQVKVFRYFARRRPQAAVVECMAVWPEFQWISERQFIHSTIGVITNARLDHIQEMGPSLENITRSLCNTLPSGGVAFTCEDRMFPVMKEQAEKLGCDLRRVDPSSVTLDELSGFDHIEHADNVAVALAVCQSVGVPRSMALEGMYHGYADVGALRIFEIVEDSRLVRFIYAMAANDPESTLAVWEKTKNRISDKGVVIILLHTRADRFDRALQLLQMIRDGMAGQFDYLFLTGEKATSVFGALPRYGLDQTKALKLGRTAPQRVFEAAIERIPSAGTIFGIGNVGAGGLEIVRHFRDRRIVHGVTRPTA